MTPQAGRKLLVMAFVIAIAMTTWDEIHNNHEWPKPARYVGAGVAFGLLGILAPLLTDQLSGLMGAGFTLALVYKTYAKNALGAAVGSAAGAGASGSLGSAVGSAAGAAEGK